MGRLGLLGSATVGPTYRTFATLSTAGIFQSKPLDGRSKGEIVKVHFWLPEGEICLTASSRKTEAAKGLGLKFQTLDSKGISNLTIANSTEFVWNL